MSAKDRRIRELQERNDRQASWLEEIGVAAGASDPTVVNDTAQYVAQLRKRAHDAEAKAAKLTELNRMQARSQDAGLRDLLSETAAAAGYTASDPKDLPAFVTLLRKHRADAEQGYAVADQAAQKSAIRIMELVGHLDAATLRVEVLERELDQAWFQRNVYENAYRHLANRERNTLEAP